MLWHLMALQVITERFLIPLPERWQAGLRSHFQKRHTFQKHFKKGVHF